MQELLQATTGDEESWAHLLDGRRSVAISRFQLEETSNDAASGFCIRAVYVCFGGCG